MSSRWSDLTKKIALDFSKAPNLLNDRALLFKIMTKEEFNILKTGDDVLTDSGTSYKVAEIYPIQGIVMVKLNHFKNNVPFRYENCELVVKDELVEYMSHFTSNPKSVCKDIRSIVRKEVIEGLKFPSYAAFLDFFAEQSLSSVHEWFIEQVKKLNA